MTDREKTIAEENRLIFAHHSREEQRGIYSTFYSTYCINRDGGNEEQALKDEMMLAELRHSLTKLEPADIAHVEAEVPKRHKAIREFIERVLYQLHGEPPFLDSHTTH